MSKKYPSRYSNGKEISAAQYITEFICEKMADKNKSFVTSLFVTEDFKDIVPVEHTFATKVQGDFAAYALFVHAGTILLL